MHAARLSAIRLLSAMLALGGSAANAAPKAYVLSGKHVDRGLLINVPMVGNVGCNGAGLANLTVMSGPGGSMVPAPYTSAGRTMTQIANNNGCVAHVPGKKITTSGAGVGGAFVMPTGVLAKSSAGTAVVVPNATPVKQLFTSFRITGPRSANAITATAVGTMATGMNSAAFHGFKKGAWVTQTGRQGSMFTWCWGNPGCAKITEGSHPLIVKYRGGGNGFGGTMAYVISGGPEVSNIAVAPAPGGPIGFGILPTTGSQPSGRGYAVKRVDVGTPGPLWGMYMASSKGRITIVSIYLGMNFPKATNSNFGFPFTTRTVLARNTGTFAGNPRITTVTARGGDTVTAMGQRNLSLVAGGVARSSTYTATPAAATMSNVPEIAQMYLPEPGGAASLFAGAAALLAVAASRRRR